MQHAMARTRTLQRIASIAEDQWGLVTRRQAQKAGIPATTLERLTANGSVLERVAQGVYRFTGAPQPDHLDLRAAWLQLTPHASRFGLRKGDGLALLRWLLDLVGDRDTPRWMEDARAHVAATRDVIGAVSGEKGGQRT